MRVHFDLELNSPEAMIGSGLGVLGLIIVALWSGGHGPDITNNVVQVKDSPGTDVHLDQSKHTSVVTNVAVNVVRARPEPPQSPRPNNHPTGSSKSQDDAFGIVVMAFAALAFAGYFYMRHFEVVTFVSRMVCFAAASYALLGYALDTHRHGILFDEIQWGYLLAGFASGIAAGLLLQAQALITPEMVEAAAREQGALKFFLQRIKNGEGFYVLVSLLCTAVIFFVSLASLLAILRALVLSRANAEPRSWLPRFLLGATEWVQPVPFAVIASLGLGVVVFMLYEWLPRALQI